MLIAFVGDVHGMAFHAVAALATLQERLGRPFDLLIQVGDMGAYPDPARMDAASRRYLEAEPAQGDFTRLLSADGERAERLRRLRARFAGPIHFIRGNHEDLEWLGRLPVDPGYRTAGVDPFNLLRYVPDGAVLSFDGLRVGFLGGVEERSDAAGIDAEAYRSLRDLGAGTLDVLVTHEGPYGTSVGFRGDVHGSPMMTRLGEALRPSFHIAGHAHTSHGPRTFGPTVYLGLSSLIASARWHPEARGLQEGCLAVLDTESGDLRQVTGSWLSEFPTPFDFDSWAEGILPRQETHESNRHGSAGAVRTLSEPPTDPSSTV